LASQIKGKSWQKDATRAAAACLLLVACCYLDTQKRQVITLAKVEDEKQGFKIE
jgi:hypothetical protein